MSPEKIKEKAAKWRAQNPEKIKAQYARWRAENPEKVKAHRAKWVAENPEKYKDSYAKWCAENPEKLRAAQARADAVRRSSLTDSYVAHVMRMLISQVPPELLELKREQLKHKRALKELKEFLTEEGKSK